MKMAISHLRFSIQENPFGSNLKRIDTTTGKLREIQRKAGVSNSKFESAYSKLQTTVQIGGNLESALHSLLQIRALAILLNSSYEDLINLSRGVLDKILQIKKKPNALIVDSILNHYLKHYDQLSDLKAVEAWLATAMRERNTLTSEYIYLLRGDGPKWLAEKCRKENRDFDQQLSHMKLDRYSSGRFMTVAKNIYYLDELRKLKPNQGHQILQEMQKRTVYESRYDDHTLLGHQILKILISKAPTTEISDDWRNVILAIAGDPRVPSSHPKHQKWWSQLELQLKNKVQGWLSKLDLRLFLEALKDFSYQSGNEELRRMFASRKKFMEGLLNKQLVTGTRLYLSPSAASYLRKNYKREHLPNFSIVTDGGKSLIHVQLGSAHMIEGSHSCKLWIYEGLDPSAIVFDFSATHVSYSSLTQGLSTRMWEKGYPCKAAITHRPHSFNWQHNAIVALRSVGVPVGPKDVLKVEDYRKYKRIYGA